MSLTSTHPNPTIAVVIPCYRVAKQILRVINGIGPEISLIVVVDDACPEGSGRLVQSECKDPRVVVEFLKNNCGVGGAVLAGYRKAIQLGAGVIVKLDGDGQMDPDLIARFVKPILDEEADYTKGNRFFDLESLRGMPLLRLIGNAGLSFISKLSSGYWRVMDPTNGYTAIDSRVAAALPHDKIASRYFFESDMLFRLNTLQAVVEDIPMDAVYADEESNLKIRRVLVEFPLLYLGRFFKRIFYSYFLRNFNAASIELLAGLTLTASGIIFGLSQWARYSQLQVAAPTGTVLLATIQVILGAQLLLSWINFDLNSSPEKPISGKLCRTRSSAGVSASSNTDKLSRNAA